MPRRRIHLPTFAKMYLAGVLIKDICDKFGVGRTACKNARASLGLTPRPKGWRPEGHAARMSVIMKRRHALYGPK